MRPQCFPLNHFLKAQEGLAMPDRSSGMTGRILVQSRHRAERITGSSVGFRRPGLAGALAWRAAAEDPEPADKAAVGHETGAAVAQRVMIPGVEVLAGCVADCPVHPPGPAADPSVAGSGQALPRPVRFAEQCRSAYAANRPFRNAKPATGTSGLRTRIASPIQGAG